MAIGKDGTVRRQIRALFHAGALGDLTDGQLLERFATETREVGETAFGVLVERHGPMVLRVCRSVLTDPNDAQDAFQATFLVLVGKARGLWVRDSLGPWLHQVAYRTAKCARASAARRQRLERRAAVTEGVTPRDVFDAGWAHLLHAEIERLPERLRAPLILCDLQGRTHEQAARHLGWPIGTVKSRQSRGRDRLRDRLVRGGHVPSVPMLISALKPDAITSVLPPALLESTTRAAIGSLAVEAVLPVTISILAREVLRSMSFTRWWKAAAVVLALGATLGGAALSAQKENQDDREGPPAKPTAAADLKVFKLGKPKLTLSERGTVEAPNVQSVVSEVEGPTDIIFIKPEGSLVRPNELVVELDSATLKDKLTDQIIATARASSELKNAENAHKIAEIAVKEYDEGNFLMEKDALVREQAIAEAAIRRTEARLERLRRAKARLKEGVEKKGTPDEILAELQIEDRIDEADLALLRERGNRQQAQAKLDVLEKYTRGRVKLDLEIAEIRARAEVLNKTPAFSLAKSKEDKLRQMIAKCKIYAERGGLVVYADAPSAFGRATIEENATVRERQPILRIVDLERPMRVNAKVRESLVDRVVVGQTAKVRVDAFPNEEFEGIVRSVSPRPDPEAVVAPAMGPGDPGGRQSPRKVYSTMVEITGGNRRLRPGMTAEVTLVVETSGGSFDVPNSAIALRDGRFHLAIKSPDGRFSWREVSVLERGDTTAKIQSVGLKAGDVIAEDAKDVPSDPAKPEPEASTPKKS